MTGPCTAPARYPLTVLHKQADGPPDPLPDTGEPVTGWTVCAAPMRASELWTELDWKPGDRLCGGCFPGQAPPPVKGYVQEAMI